MLKKIKKFKILKMKKNIQRHNKKIQKKFYKSLKSKNKKIKKKKLNLKFKKENEHLYKILRNIILSYNSNQIIKLKLQMIKMIVQIY